MDDEGFVVNGISKLRSLDVGLSPAPKNKCEDIAFFLGNVCPDASIDHGPPNGRYFEVWSNDEEKGELR